MTCQYHDQRFDPIALWQFDGTLTDVVGGYTWTNVAGQSTQYADISPGLYGLSKSVTNRFELPTLPALNITSDFTIMMLVSVGAYDSGANNNLIACARSGQNTLFQLRLAQDTNRIDYIHQYGGGTTVTHNTGVGLVPGVLYHLAVRRQSNIVQVFMSGDPIGVTSGTLTAPSGINTQFWTLYGPSDLGGGIASLIMFDKALTDEEIKESSNCVLAEFVTPEVYARGGDSVIMSIPEIPDGTYNIYVGPSENSSAPQAYSGVEGQGPNVIVASGDVRFVAPSTAVGEFALFFVNVDTKATILSSRTIIVKPNQFQSQIFRYRRLLPRRWLVGKRNNQEEEFPQT
jgi:hypothetical protein